MRSLRGRAGPVRPPTSSGCRRTSRRRSQGRLISCSISRRQLPRWTSSRITTPSPSAPRRVSAACPRRWEAFGSRPGGFGLGVPLHGKVGGAFTSSATQHGGNETTLFDHRQPPAFRHGHRSVCHIATRDRCPRRDRRRCALRRDHDRGRAGPTAAEPDRTRRRAISGRAHRQNRRKNFRPRGVRPPQSQNSPPAQGRALRPFETVAARPANLAPLPRCECDNSTLCRPSLSVPVTNEMRPESGRSSTSVSQVPQR